MVKAYSGKTEKYGNLGSRVKKFGGDEGTRTPGLCVANASLYQLSHIPTQRLFYY